MHRAVWVLRKGNFDSQHMNYLGIVMFSSFDLFTSMSCHHLLNLFKLISLHPSSRAFTMGWITSTFSWCSLLMYSQMSFTLLSCKIGAVPRNLLSNLIELEVAHPHLVTKRLILQVCMFSFFMSPLLSLAWHTVWKARATGETAQLAKETKLLLKNNPKKSIGLFKVILLFSGWNW